MSSNVLFSGGGWTPNKNEGFATLGFRSISGKHYKYNNKVLGMIPRSTNNSLVSYLEYGLTNKLCFIFYSPLISMSKQEMGIDSLNNTYESDNAIGLGDIDFGFKRSLIKGKYNLSVSLILGLPTGDFTAGKTKQLRLGNGDFRQFLRFDLSRSFKSSWATVYAGYNNRTSGFSSDIQFGGEFGWKRKGFHAILKSYARLSLNNGSKTANIYPSIYSNNVEYIGAGPQILYLFKNNFGILLEAGFAFYGRNIVYDPSLTFGIAYNIKKK